jgi:flagellin-like protein
MKKLLRNKRAVSPVLASVLMIMVAIIGMSFLFAFFVNYAADYQLGRGSAVLESMVIENVWIRDSSTVWIWVYNVGEVELEISDVFVNDFQASFTSDSDQGIVAVEGHGRLVVTPSVLLVEHVNYVFKLVTARGSAVEGSYLWE